MRSERDSLCGHDEGRCSRDGLDDRDCSDLPGAALAPAAVRAAPVLRDHELAAGLVSRPRTGFVERPLSLP